MCPTTLTHTLNLAGCRPQRAQSRRGKPVTVTAADVLPLAQLRNLRALGISAGVDCDSGRRGGYWGGTWVCVKQLSKDEFAMIASALAQCLQRFETGSGFLPPRALAIMAVLRFEALKCVLSSASAT